MAIARVQSVSANTGIPSNATTLVLTFGAATTSGNTVIVAVCNSTDVILKVTSAHGIFYNATPASIDSTAGTAVTQIFYAVMTGADTAITIARAAGGSISIVSAVAAEYSGALILPDAIPSAIGTVATNAANTGNLTNTNANALFIGAIGIKTTSATQNSSWAFNNVAPFSIVNSITTNNNSAANIDRGICYLDAVVSTAASRGANINHTYGINRYAGLIATFDQGASGGVLTNPGMTGGWR